MDLLKKRLDCYDELLRAARGEITVDLLIQGGHILNVLTGEILKGDLAVHKGFIVSMFTEGIQARQVVDARDKVAVPAFIDPHVHIESSMVLPPGYAEVAAANGTGTILADPHEIVNVMGMEGWSMMADNAADLPVRLLFDIPTCVPCKREAESSGGHIKAPEVRELARRGARKLGELMSFGEIVAGEEVMTDIIKAGWELGLPRDAHYPMIDVLGGLFSSLNPLQLAGVMLGMLGSKLLRWPGANALPMAIITRKLRKQGYKDLNAYLVALGPTADHETYGPEIQAKLDHGMRLIVSSHIFLTMPMMMPLLLQGVRRLRYKDAIGMCTDDIWPDDLLTMGGMAGVLRLMVKNGVSPVDAVRFATLNNAQRLASAGIPEASLLGMLAPGMAADIALVAAPLRKFKIDMVIHGGKVVAENGKLVVPLPQPRATEAAMNSVPVPPVSADTFRISVPAGHQGSTARVRVLELPKPPALPFPEMSEADIPVADGRLDTRGYMLIAVFNRYGRLGDGPVIGLVRNYSLKRGAVASTLSHDSHNLIVLGTNPEDMAAAANEVIRMKGGMAAADGGRLLASIALPVGGLMTTGSVADAAPLAEKFRKAIGTLGLDPKSPIMPFAAFSLPAAPGAKVTDRGIWDGSKQTLVSLFV